MKLFRAQEAAARLGISKQTLLRYEKMGIVPQPRRNRINSWRVYTQNDIEEIKQHLKKGITLVEMIMVLLILGIIAVAAVPRIQGFETIKLAGAVKALVSDIRYVQQLAVARHTQTRIVFVTSNETYSAQEYFASNATWQPILSPFTRANLTVDYAVPPYAGTNINNASFNGSSTLTFDWNGAPAAGGGVALSRGSAVRSILVENQTGRVTAP